jgi:hypothetical protein
MVQNPYGIVSVSPLTQLECELQAFRLNPPAEVGGLGRENHFWNVAELMWGPKAPAHFVRNPWAEKMIHWWCKEQYVAVLGAANSSKTDTASIWAIVNWACDPENTMVMVTSTSLKDSKKRVWGRIVHYFSACPGLPGRLVDSMGIIKTDVGSGIFKDNQGIALIAGEKKKEKDAVGKMIGVKAKRLIMIADELPELSEAILTAFFSNLANNPSNQLIGIGNFASCYDPLGVLARPKSGYSSITPDDEEWVTETGYCIRFDGLKSPNILCGEDRYPFLYNSKNLANHRKTLGENSAALWRMCRSFPCPIGDQNVIYAEADLNAGKVADQPYWVGPPMPVSSMDPAFSNGGDRAVQLLGLFGQTINGLWTLAVTKYLRLDDDVADPTPRDYQIARQFRDNCKLAGIDPANAAIDSTAAGSVLLSIIHEEWDRRVLGINFSGTPSDSFVNVSDEVTALYRFDRRVSELWWVGKDFMKYGQIKGINDDLARELKARRYDHAKGPEGLKIRVEPKKDMKERLGFSPDIADAWTVLVDLCRQRFGWLAGGLNTGQHRIAQNQAKEFENYQAVYQNVTYEPEVGIEDKLAEPTIW